MNAADKVRGDASLVREVARRFGIPAARRLQRPPFVKLPLDLPALHARHMEEKDGPGYRGGVFDELEFWRDYEAAQLWDDVLLQCPYREEGDRAGEAICRIARRRTIPELRDNSPWWNGGTDEHLERDVEHHVVGRENGSLVVDLFLSHGPGAKWTVQSSILGDGVCICYLDKELQNCSIDKQKGGYRLPMVMLNYVIGCTERTVQVSPRSEPTPKQRREGHARPWVRRDLPWCILIKPGDAPRHGSPGTASRRQGTGTPKMPHGRRGHWRHLGNGAKVFVRPCWIGPACWNAAGRIYSVVPSEPKNVGKPPVPGRATAVASDQPERRAAPLLSP